jgi:hypothetical protein
VLEDPNRRYKKQQQQLSRYVGVEVVDERRKEVWKDWRGIIRSSSGLDDS